MPIEFRFSDVSTVILQVGTGKKKTAFQVHEDLLCAHPSFFGAAFTSQRKESKDREMELPSDDPGTIEEFIAWLYTQKYELEIVRKGDRHWMQKAAELYILADKYNVILLKNAICIALVNRHNTPGVPLPARRQVAYVYKNTSAGSQLRTLLSDWYAWSVALSWFVQDPIKAWLLCHPEFAVYLLASMSQRGSLRPKAKNPLENLHGAVSGTNT